MDVEKLINLVHERKPAWDMRDKDYNKRDVQRKLWNEIAEEMDIDVDDVKKKWRGLRDTYRKEFQKLKKFKSGQEATQEGAHSTWAYFEYLSFLSNVMDRRKLQRNVSPEKDESDIVSEIDSDLFGETDPFSETPNDAFWEDAFWEESRILQPSTSHINKHKRKKLNQKSVDDQFLEIEKEKLKILTENRKMQDNSDYQFLISLLPFLSDVPNNRKLIVRNKIQKILIDEEIRSTTSAPLLSPASSVHSNFDDV